MAWPSFFPERSRARRGLYRKPERSRLSAPIWSALSYSVLVAVTFAVAFAFGRTPLQRTPWLPTSGIEANVASLILGLAIAALTLLATRALGARVKWARALEGELRPIVAGSSDAAIVVMALASGVGEELFFRGLLSPWVGVVISSLLFGAVHQVRGPGRFGWMASAAALGLAYALVFGATGSLLGPVVSHVVINYLNLRGLRASAPHAATPRLGGILKR